MKKANREDKKTSNHDEITRLKKENKKLAQKLETAKNKNKELSREIKKKDVLTIELSKEQQQLLSNLLNDINIQNL